MPGLARNSGLMPGNTANVRQLVPLSVGDPVASATAAVPVLRDGTVLATDMLVFASEVIRMTGRAVRLVLRPGPGNVGADGITVAGGTTRISAMIARVVPVRIVAEVGRGPAVGGMTHVALRGRG